MAYFIACDTPVCVIMIVRAHFNPYNAEIFSQKTWRTKGFYQFEIIIKNNVLVSSFLGNSFSAGTVFIRQNLTSTDVSF